MAVTDNFSFLDELRIADPDTYVWVKARLTLVSPLPGNELIKMLVDATIWGLSQEAGLGKAVAEGFLKLMDGAGRSRERIHIYENMVRQAAQTGPTFGRIMATFLSPVLMKDDVFLERFKNTLAIMQRKGTYTLTAPLKAMVVLLSAGEDDCAYAYLDLLATVFTQKLTYNQSHRLVYLIPKAVSGFTAKRRKAQIMQLHNIARTDLNLVDTFLDGLEKGLDLLDKDALDDFVAQALTIYDQAPALSEKFLSLSSKVGKDAYAALQKSVTLEQVSGQLNRYLQARIGKPVMVKPLSKLAKDEKDIPWVCADGRHIYLLDEIDCFPTPFENRTVYKALSRLEAGYFEYGTFDFDLEKAGDRYPEVACQVAQRTEETDLKVMGDAQRFINTFFPHTLATDLFNLFEQARVALHLRHRYPGLMEQVTPMIWSNIQDIGWLNSDHPLIPVFIEIVVAKKGSVIKNHQYAALNDQLAAMFRENIDIDSSVEASARLVCRAFDLICRELGQIVNRYISLNFPFNRRLHWDLVSDAFASQEKIAIQVKARLKKMGMDVYQSDLRNRLVKHGVLTVDDIVELVFVRSQQEPSAKISVDLSELNMQGLLQRSDIDMTIPNKADEDAIYYPEWAHHLQDYLHDHTRVYDVEVSCESGDAQLYRLIQDRRKGLVANVRRAFELLKPERLALLRQWPEGDAFDYRALLDFAIDRRAGRIPSDRLFIKRLKQERDVAVMLLVDLSRSTGNPVFGGHTSVLDVTKEALVLFCEALQVVGDDYAVSGFSGTGRHCVEFYNIKGFEESLTDKVRSRIAALKPQRSTRMGAAIRHGITLLGRTDAKIRLMIIVSDGFPNDIGYKSDYAIADTARSIQEARSRNFHIKAITVNIGSDPRLDDLYGRAHHHIIGDVYDLPDKLIRMYGALTRF